MGLKENKVIKLSFRNKMYFMFKMKMAKHQVSTQYYMTGLWLSKCDGSWIYSEHKAVSKMSKT